MRIQYFSMYVTSWPQFKCIGEALQVINIIICSRCPPPWIHAIGSNCEAACTMPSGRVRTLQQEVC